MIFPNGGSHLTGLRPQPLEDNEADHQPGKVLAKKMIEPISGPEKWLLQGQKKSLSCKCHIKFFMFPKG